jgi:hypothetical protein
MSTQQRAIDLLQSIAAQAVALQHSDIVWDADDIDRLIWIDNNLDLFGEL